MIYQQFGIELVRLEREHIEMLRLWRNAPEIVRNMEYQETITKEMQTKWFLRINNINNFYFLIRKEGAWAGMIHLSDIDYEAKKANAGIFISDPAFIHSTIPVCASLGLLELAFEELKLENIYIKINRNNDRALKYNKYLGFIYMEAGTHPDFIKMVLSKKDYHKKTMPLRRSALKLFHPEKTLFFQPDNPLDQEIKTRFFPSMPSTPPPSKPE